MRCHPKISEVFTSGLKLSKDAHIAQTSDHSLIMLQHSPASISAHVDIVSTEDFQQARDVNTLSVYSSFRVMVECLSAAVRSESSSCAFNSSINCLAWCRSDSVSASHSSGCLEAVD